MSTSAERIKAMDDTRNQVTNYYTPAKAFVFSTSFETWETDKIIQVISDSYFRLIQHMM